MTILNSFRRFLRDDRGGVLIEFLLMLPLLIWAWIALTVFWDVFRTMNSAQKAAYSISDLISRQEVNLEDDFVDGMHDVYQFLMVNNAETARIRITSFAYDAINDKYLLIFSESPYDKVPKYQEADLEQLRDRIPLMGHTDSVVLVEASIDFTFPFEIPILGRPGVLITGNVETEAGGARTGQGNATTIEFSEFVITRPRFKSFICLQDEGCPILF